MPFKSRCNRMFNVFITLSNKVLSREENSVHVLFQTGTPVLVRLFFESRNLYLADSRYGDHNAMDGGGSARLDDDGPQL